MRERVGLGLGAILAAAFLAASSPAGATTFDFSYSALDGSFSGEGEFITGSGTSPYLLSNVTGTAVIGDVGSIITGMSAFASADNLLYFPSQPYTDFFGISFATVSAGDFNLYFNTVEFNGYGVIKQSADPTGMSSGTEVRLEVSATPLPAALPLLASGLGAMALLLWWQRRRNADDIRAVLIATTSV